MEVGRILIILVALLFAISFCNADSNQAKRNIVEGNSPASNEEDWFDTVLRIKPAIPQNTTTGPTDAPQQKKKSKMTLYEGLASSFIFIFLSEVGDKTFIYLMICTSRINIIELFFISNLALGGMHVLGTLFGAFLHNVISIFWLKIVSIVIFLYFGISLIYEGFTEEEEDVDHKIEHAKVELLDGDEKLLQDQENNDNDDRNDNQEKSCWGRLKEHIYKFQALGVFWTILALEMGDMSQFSAIILAANYGLWTVIIGGLVGHWLAICIALGFGKMLLSIISEKAMHIIGGVCFLAFSAFTVFNLLMGK